MEQFFKKIEGFQILIVGIFFSLCMIVSTSIFSKTLSRSGIEVTGSAVAIVKSDSATWTLTVTTASASKKAAFDNLVKDKNTVLNYLKLKGFSDTEIEVQNANPYPIFKKAPNTGEETSVVDHYEISQTILVNSTNISLVKDISLDAENLLSKGIDVRSDPPAYFYTKLADLKVQLLNQASEDAKKRAKAMLRNTGSHLGGIKSIKTGVFQITPPNSTEVSDYGMYDTSTIDKKVTAVTQVIFKIK